MTALHVPFGSFQQKKGAEVPYTWELNSLIWSRMNVHERSVSHLSGSAWDLVFSPLRLVQIVVLFL